MSIELTDAERDSVAVRLLDEAFTGPDHKMWGAIEDVVATRIAGALREAADNVFMDESLEGRTAMVRTNEAWRLLLTMLADQYDPEASDAVV